MEEKRYKIVNGTYYSEKTSDIVIGILERARLNAKRVRIFYGDSNTGLDWMETEDIMGTIGRSTGSIKIPLLIKSARSRGGPGILDHCVVKITIDKKIVCQHPYYRLPLLSMIDASNELKAKGYFYSLLADGEVIHNCKTSEEVQRAIKFYQGENNKL